MSDFEPFGLEPSSGFKTTADRRPRVPEPIPVRLVSIEDVNLPATAGLEHLLDDFYINLLAFVKEPYTKTPVYRADNFLLKFHLIEGLVERDHYRPIQIEVPSLADTERKLMEAEMEYTRQRGLTPGAESILLTDPAGNWLELIELRLIM